MPETSLHEDFQRKQEDPGGSDRGFGVVFAIFFTLLSLLPLRAHQPVRWWGLACAAISLGVALLQPGWLGPLNRVWTMLGLGLGRVMSPIVTGIIFLLVVTPIGFLFRRLKKDPLRLASSAISSYWIARETPGPYPETMRRQF